MASLSAIHTLHLGSWWVEWATLVRGSPSLAAQVTAINKIKLIDGAI
jgi:hypothetical protein